MSQILLLVIAGIAVGCVYALVALGFVLIYKATEVVNFAQGELMMLGGFIGLALGCLLYAVRCSVVVTNKDSFRSPKVWCDWGLSYCRPAALARPWKMPRFQSWTSRSTRDSRK